MQFAVIKIMDRYKTTIDYEINDGRQKFVALEVEVYHIILTTC